MSDISKVLMTPTSILELADLMEDRRHTGDAGKEDLAPLLEDEAFLFWQHYWRGLANDVDLPTEAKLRLGSSSHVAAVQAVQAVLEAAHKYFGLDRQRLIDLARHEGPPDTYLDGKPASR